MKCGSICPWENFWVDVFIGLDQRVVAQVLIYKR